ncbi:hypothetical protein DY000_02024430 [Brassica cretica]|uniref:Uncharacterized protein n=1 Tax=Brassica cretica TaxID=69181 RepID=A0ABQ7E7J8_BRACR|nr:hypothetical protein DY000_02024430 [Brassica cretica]
MNIGQVWRVRRGVEAVGSPTRVAKPGRDGDVGLTRVPLPARTERELHRRSDVGSSTRGRLPARTERELRRRSDAGSSTRDRLPARTERELHRRSDAGRRTRGVVPARTERDSVDGLTRGNQLGLSPVISTRVVSFP